MWEPLKNSYTKNLVILVNIYRDTLIYLISKVLCDLENDKGQISIFSLKCYLHMLIEIYIEFHNPKYIGSIFYTSKN